VIAVRSACVLVIAAALTSLPVRAVDETTPLRFAWPAHAAAAIQLTDERSVGKENRTVVMTMRLRVAPNAATGRLVLFLSDARLLSIDGATPGETDPSQVLLNVGRVMKAVTPTLVVGPDGRFVEVRDLDRLVRDVMSAVGFPAAPPGAAFGDILSDAAKEDWGTWVGAWLGDRLAPGETAPSERTMEIDGATVSVRTTRRGLTPSVPTGRRRLEATAVYPSSAVQQSTRGLLIDSARETRELGGDPVATQEFLDGATYSPVTETLTVELDAATMQPFFAEKTRTFSAVNGKHRVDGRERRSHRFVWVAEDAVPPSR
jgi:hypothetical protein